MSDTLLLIDLSSIAHPEWHTSQKDPNPNATSIKTIARVRALACEHPHAAICCDSGRSFRHEIDPTYKANRPEAIAPLQHQIRVAADALVEDGFPVWLVKGYEADDLIATATRLALACDGDVLIASADKDLLQLVGPHVQVKRLTDGAIWDEATVLDKLKVRPDQMVDYLSLVGDTSDNIIGAKGIGATKASALLATFGSIDAFYQAIDKGDGGAGSVVPSIINSMLEFRERWPTVRALITLKTDAPIPFEEIASERKVRPADVIARWIAEDEGAPAEEESQASPAVSAAVSPPVAATDATRVAPSAGDSVPSFQTPAVAATDGARAVSNRVAPSGGDSGQASAPAMTAPVSNPVAPKDAGSGQLAIIDYERQLEPRSLGEANKLAAAMFQSRLFSAYGTAEGIFSTILAGRELGLPAMASLRAMHIIEGKPCLSADTMRAMVLRSGLAEYFRMIERTADRATFETKRKSDPVPVSLTFTFAEAQTAGSVKKGSGWERYPADMLVARASAKLARLVYPDVISGLYDASEVS